MDEGESKPEGFDPFPKAADFDPFPKPTETPRTEPAVRWLTDKKRVERYELLFPFALDELEYRAVLVGRPTVKEIDDFLMSFKADPNQPLRFPVFHDERGAPLSEAFWETLDDDDRVPLLEIATGFLPARFLAKSSEPKPSGSDQATSATGDNSSAT